MKKHSTKGKSRGNHQTLLLLLSPGHIFKLKSIAASLRRSYIRTFEEMLSQLKDPKVFKEFAKHAELSNLGADTENKNITKTGSPRSFCLSKEQIKELDEMHYSLNIISRTVFVRCMIDFFFDKYVSKIPEDKMKAVLKLLVENGYDVAEIFVYKNKILAQINP